TSSSREWVLMSEAAAENVPAVAGESLPSDQLPLRSVDTTSFPQILEQLHASLMVTACQAGKLLMLCNDGGVLNTHFHVLNKPMGLAVTRGRLAIGTSHSIYEYHNVPAAAGKVSAEKPHDAAWLPRHENVTGDVQIHEMAWVQRDGESTYESCELWFVNTAFSCLATRSDEFSFEPRWRPKFVTHYLPEDRCHLNGMAVVDGRVKYVTALG